MDDAARLEKANAVADLAEELDMPPAQFALAWCLKNPHVSTVMLGASKSRQLKENLEAMALVERIDESVMKRVAEITQE